MKKCRNRDTKYRQKDGGRAERWMKGWRMSGSYDWFLGAGQIFWWMGYAAHRHLQALDDALELEGLAPEGVVSAVASGGSHHLRPPVPRHKICCKEKDGKEDLSACTCVFLADGPLPLWRLSHLQMWGFDQRRRRTIRHAASTLRGVSCKHWLHGRDL